MVAAAWYYVKDEAVTGPVDRMTLMEHTFSGQVEADTLIWSAWDDRPRPIHAVPEFSTFLSAAAIERSEDAARSFTSPLLARVAAASWILLGGMMLVVFMVVGVLMLGHNGVGPWRLPALIMGAGGALMLVREGHLTLQGRRERLRATGCVTALLGGAFVALTLTVDALAGFGSFGFIAGLLMASGLAALVADRRYRNWYVSNGS
jgi:drug/metabolite transporter (DMT)-like permease